MSKEAIVLIVIHVFLFIGIMFTFYRSTGWSALTKHYRCRGKFVPTVDHDKRADGHSRLRHPAWC